MRGWPLIKLLPQKTNFQFVKYARAAGVLGVQRVVQLWAGLTRLAEDRRALEICLLGALI